MEMHTIERCRKEFWEPTVCDRAGLQAWMQGGKKTAVDRARVRWQKLLAEHQDPPLDAVIAKQLDQFVETQLS
jgi:trimethylamine:corrinoid methyltransferase-like protein